MRLEIRGADAPVDAVEAAELEELRKSLEEYIVMVAGDKEITSSLWTGQYYYDIYNVTVWRT